MPESAGPAALRAYLPITLTRRLSAEAGGAASAAQGRQVLEQGQGTVLFADIQGFTPLTEALSRAGARGAERMAAILDRAFGQLIDEVAQHGGDVINFAGDAMVAFFPAVTAYGPGAAVARAAAAALQSQVLVDGMATGVGIQLRLRMGVGCGGFSTVVLDEVEGAAAFFAVGEALDQAFAALDSAPAGKVGLSPTAAIAAGRRLRTAPLGAGFRQLLAVEDDVLAVPLPLPELEAARMAPFVPQVVRTRLAARQFDFLSELRRVSVLFVHLPDLATGHDDLGPAAERSFAALQRALARFGGGVDKLVNDEKGTVALAAFGLPPRVYEDGAVRAVRAAQAVHEGLAAAGIACSIGVATGEAFCGAYGNTRRREFTVIGVAVNLAARLMGAAQGDILCDEATFEAARGKLRFASAGPLRVKGFGGHVAAFRPLATGVGPGSQPRGDRAVVGRVKERARLQARLDELVDQGAGGVVVIEGEAGIGKSVLLADLAARAAGRDLFMLEGGADAIERTTAWYPWRAVLEQLLLREALPPGTRPGSLAADPQARAAAWAWIQQALSGSERIARWAPLLGDLLPLGVSPNQTTQGMEGEGRSDSLSEVLLELFRASAGDGPMLLLLDDLHWFDSASLAFTLAALRALPRLLVVATTRPVADPVPIGLRDLLSLAGDDRILIEELGPQEVVALVARRLRVDTLPPAVARLIHQKAGGHPLFSEELGVALRESGVLLVEDGRAILAPGIRDLNQVALPDTVQGIITSRINGLNAQEQLVLKVASVVGRIFAYRVLREVHPVEEDLPKLQGYVDTLADADLTPLETPEPELAWMFKHVIIQEVAYNLMLPGQRAQLHEAVGRLLEAGSAEEIEAHVPLLAFHWSQTSRDDKAVDYLERAARQALQQNANAEAWRFFQMALRRDARRGSPSSLRRARWLEGVAIARARLTEWSAVREAAVELLALVGHPYPSSPARVGLAILGNMGLQVLHRTFPRLFPVAQGRRREALLLASSGYALVANQAYMQSETLDLMLGCWRSLNLADRAGPSAERSRGLSNVGLILATTGMEKTSAKYHDEAVAVAAQVEDAFEHAFAQEVAAVSAVHLTDAGRLVRFVQGALDGFSRMGNQSLWEQTHSVIGNHHLYVGELDIADRWWRDLWASAWPHGAPQHQALAAAGLLASGLLRGQVDRDLLERCDRIINRGLPRVDHLRLSGLMALAWADQQEPVRAQDAARRTEALIAEERPTVMYAIPGLTALFDYYRRVLDSGEVSGLQRRELEAAMVVVVDTVKVLALLHKASKPPYARLQGLLAVTRGQPAKARRCFRKAIKLAARSGYQLDQGLSLLHLAELEPPGSPARKALRDQAAAVLERTGAVAPLHAFDARR